MQDKRTEIEASEKKLADLDVTIKHVITQQERQQEIKRIQDSLDAVVKQKEELQANIIELTGQIEKGRADCQNSDATLKSKQIEITEKQKELEDVKKQISDLQKDIPILKQEHIDAQAQLDADRKQIKTIETK